MSLLESPRLTNYICDTCQASDHDTSECPPVDWTTHEATADCPSLFAGTNEGELTHHCPDCFTECNWDYGETAGERVGQ